MNNASFLKGLRIVLALLFFIPITLFFCDYADKMPHETHALLMTQLVPAVLSGMGLIVVVLLLLTLLFGRIYCSTICPMGVLQDVISFFSRKGKKKNKKKRWFKYSKPQNILRYSILGVCTLLLVFGITTPLLLLDPYSNFGRIGTNLLRPALIGGNNLINSIALHFDNYSFYHVSIYSVTMLSLTAALVALLTVGILSYFRGRLFCNTICPVGALLSLASRFSLFKIVMDEKKCNSCGSCARACKSECIDSKNKKIDSSRCVSCYNCLSRCKQGGIHYKYAWKKEPKVIEFAAIDQTYFMEEKERKQKPGRRSFLLAGAGLATSLPIIPAFAQQTKDITKLKPITPPGSLSLVHFKEKCTACHLCVTHCPQQILHPAGFNFGLEYALKPHLVFKTAYCNYECTVCADVCPNKALIHISKEEKKTTQMGIAQFEQARCVVNTEGTDCGACSEHCPTQAVKMVPYQNGLRIPQVTPDLCIGCGGCEYICPVRPIKAINVLANSVHQEVQKPKEEEMQHFEVDDFGF